MRLAGSLDSSKINHKIAGMGVNRMSKRHFLQVLGIIRSRSAYDKTMTFQLNWGCLEEVVYLSEARELRAAWLQRSGCALLTRLL